MAGLKEGCFYKFRVRAVNAAGIGEPGEVTDIIEMKDRIGITFAFFSFTFTFLVTFSQNKNKKH